MPLDSFTACFKLLTGHAPFPWQEALYQRFTQGDIPAHGDLPTGLGKTSVIAVWLIALADHPARVPRRLAYVVNRRTVVDQTTAEVEKMRANLAAAGLDGALRKLCALPLPSTACPLAVSTLRGALAENREWSADPCRPAVIVGTVDLIGSRLLFSGYRAGFKTRPLFAGLLGQDTLIIHDEAHLEPAFQELLTAIAAEQRHGGDARPVRIMQLSATARGDAAGFTLGPADEADLVVSKRLRAVKRLTLHPLDDPKRLPDALVERALPHKASGVAVLVFARQVETVEKVAARLAAAGCAVRTLTGTMRGHERDGLVKKPEFRRFLPANDAPADETAAGTVYLVCTSAGEVGVNLSADHLVCDLTAFESMAQRLGRVNRFGECADTRVDVVHPVAFDAAALAEERTLALLGQLQGDASPAALRSLDAAERAAAFSPAPKTRPTSAILFDAWAMTSITNPLTGRPSVEPYLHGELEDEPPVTQVAWREEVSAVSVHDALASPPDREDLTEMLADYPLKPHEILRDRSYRVADALVRLVKRGPGRAEMPAWLVDDEGRVSVTTVGELTGKDQRERINGRTVLLPPRAGGLRDGLLDADSDQPASDVADEWRGEDGVPRRHRVFGEFDAMPPSMRLIRRIELRAPSPADDATDADEAGSAYYWWWYERPSGADSEGSAFARAAVELDTHNADVERHARAFAEKLCLEPALAEAVGLAGRFHDLGKCRADWQRGIGNFEKSLWLAKSDGRKVPRDLALTYRHEFGSLLDVCERDDWRKLLPDDHARDVLLHLIAAHHGRARPHFAPDEAEDRQHPRASADALAAETPRRFARLQRLYGRWGLAFLESLVRAADYAASADPSATLGEEATPP